MLLATMKMWYY